VRKVFHRSLANSVRRPIIELALAEEIEKALKLKSGLNGWP
jgi:hypothetical protein